jgi:hypothetical protein
VQRTRKTTKIYNEEIPSGGYAPASGSPLTRIPPLTPIPPPTLIPTRTLTLLTTSRFLRSSPLALHSLPTTQTTLSRALLTLPFLFHSRLTRVLLSFPFTHYSHSPFFSPALHALPTTRPTLPHVLLAFFLLFRSRVTHVVLFFHLALYALLSLHFTRFLLHNLPNLPPYSLPPFFSPHLPPYSRFPFLLPRTLRVSCRTQPTLSRALLASSFPLTSPFTRSLLQIDFTSRVIGFLLSFHLIHHSVLSTPPTLLIVSLASSLLFTLRVLPVSAIL